MNKIKNYFDGEKDERIRQGAYKAEAYAFRVLLVILGIGIIIKFFLFNFSIKSYVDELLAILISGGIYFFVMRKEKIVEKKIGILMTLFQAFCLTVLSGYYHYHFGVLHDKTRPTNDFILFLFGNSIMYLVALGILNWLLNTYNQSCQHKIDKEMDDSE
ncbi:hypothetical protein HMPREF9682_00006 [Streptococcus intermedius F0395]|uniref:DUF6773 family protein n=1 Tax=Streptococcus constellatus TaxID=76860 RepID=UPI0002329851|nr:DUF6773 family protein [Streptococcus constellatus]EHG14601.1 hypothetical protein HMPREF9682_00006 [Streptococcus intermedius F0395]